MEHEFLENQVHAAQLNSFKLDNRTDELSENIKTLRQEISAQETERQNRMSAHNNKAALSSSDNGGLGSQQDDGLSSNMHHY